MVEVAGDLALLTAKCREVGIGILAGTDFAWAESGLIPGHHLHRELELLVSIGMTPLDAIRSATSDAARCMKLDHRVGSLEEGKAADIVILNANPLDDIRHTR